MFIKETAHTEERDRILPISQSFNVWFFFKNWTTSQKLTLYTVKKLFNKVGIEESWNSS